MGDFFIRYIGLQIYGRRGFRTFEIVRFIEVLTGIPHIGVPLYNFYAFNNKGFHARTCAANVDRIKKMK